MGARVRGAGGWRILGWRGQDGGMGMDVLGQKGAGVGGREGALA